MNSEQDLIKLYVCQYLFRCGDLFSEAIMKVSSSRGRGRILLKDVKEHQSADLWKGGVPDNEDPILIAAEYIKNQIEQNESFVLVEKSLSRRGDQCLSSMVGPKRYLSNSVYSVLGRGFSDCSMEYISAVVAQSFSALSFAAIVLRPEARSSLIPEDLDGGVIVSFMAGVVIGVYDNEAILVWDL